MEGRLNFGCLSFLRADRLLCHSAPDFLIPGPTASSAGDSGRFPGNKPVFTLLTNAL
jgi:hypothetical protein